MGRFLWQLLVYPSLKAFSARACNREFLAIIGAYSRCLNHQAKTFDRAACNPVGAVDLKTDVWRQVTDEFGHLVTNDPASSDADNGEVMTFRCDMQELIDCKGLIGNFHVLIERRLVARAGIRKASLGGVSWYR